MPERNLSEIFPQPTPTALERAKLFENEGIVTLSHFEPQPIKGDVWTCGPTTNRTWQWALHSFLQFDCLIVAGKESLIATLVTEWVDRFESDIDNDFPWHDHATALRLDRICHMAIMSERCRFPALATRHARRLMDEGFYSRHTNHGFDQSVSLIIASIVFQEEPEAMSWQSTGVRRLHEEIDFAFSHEGVHVENSPGYHAGMMSNVMRAMRVLKVSNNPLNVNLKKLYDGACRFLAWMTRPDRHLVYLGDTVQRHGNAVCPPNPGPSYEAMRYAASGGAQGKPPVEAGFVFEKSGYAAWRSSWLPWKDHAHIVLKCGHLSGYHRHDDDLNIVLHAHGEDWLIDSGMYNHNQADPLRIYMRSALAHNVPFLPEYKISRKTPEHGKVRMKRLDNEEGHVFTVQAWSSMYAGASLSRRLSVENAKRFHLTDYIKTPTDSPRYWLFHVPADKQVSVAEKSVRIKGRKNSLIIHIAGGVTLNCEVYAGTHDRFPSLFSGSFNQVEETQVIVFGPSSIEKVRFIFSFAH